MSLPEMDHTAKEVRRASARRSGILPTTTASSRECRRICASPLRLSIVAYFRHVYRLTHDAEGRLLFTTEQIVPQPFGRLQLQRDAGDARDGH